MKDRSPRLPNFTLALVLSAFLLPARLAAQGIFSVDPYDGATGVSPTKAVAFVFDLPMDESATSAYFISMTDPLNPLPFTPNWSLGYLQLTCTPTVPWPNGAIFWVVDGQDAGMEPVSGSGQFTVGGSSGGHGTNAVTDFVVQVVHFYDQASGAGPALNPDLGYTFLASTTLASNRTATAISVALPTSQTMPLSQNPMALELYYAYDNSTNLTTFNTNYPGGDYTFTVTAPSSNQTVTLSLPAPALQPGTASVDNYTEAQSVNPSLPFTLRWSLPPASPAADFMSVEIGPFKTPDPGEPGALNGAARSVLIPAGTFDPSTNYEATIMLYRGNFMTNAAYTSAAFRGTSTTFDLKTTSGSMPTGPVTLTNIVSLANGDVSFEIDSSPGQTMNLETSSTLLPGSWSTWLTTNSPSGRLTITVTPTPANPVQFYRVLKVE